MSKRSKVHPTYKTKDRVTNWPEYDLLHLRLLTKSVNVFGVHHIERWFTMKRQTGVLNQMLTFV